MDTEGPLNRRMFLERATKIGAAALVAPAVFGLVGCKKQYGGGDDTVAISCENISNLTNHEKSKRDEYQYTDNSPHADKDCANCALFVPSESGDGCGTCNLVPGPISPKGHCNSWVKV